MKNENDEALLEQRVVRLNGGVVEKRLKKIREQLQALSLKSKAPITLDIRTKGGCPDASFAFNDFTQGLGVPILGLVGGGKCYSAGVIILQGCHYRVATKNSRLLVHSVALYEKRIRASRDYRTVYGRKFDDLDAAQDRVVELYASASGQSKECIEELLYEGDQTETGFYCDRALAVGLLDEVLQGTWSYAGIIQSYERKLRPVEHTHPHVLPVAVNQ